MLFWQTLRRFSLWPPSGASLPVLVEAWITWCDKSRYLSKGVLKAVARLKRPIRGALIGKDALLKPKLESSMIDLDGNWKQIHFCAKLFAVSLARRKAAAISKKYHWYAPHADINGTPGVYISCLCHDEHLKWRGEPQTTTVISRIYDSGPVGAPNFREALHSALNLHALKKYWANRGLKHSRWWWKVVSRQNLLF